MKSLRLAVCCAGLTAGTVFPLAQLDPQSPRVPSVRAPKPRDSDQRFLREMIDHHEAHQAGQKCCGFRASPEQQSDVRPGSVRIRRKSSSAWNKACRCLSSAYEAAAGTGARHRYQTEGETRDGISSAAPGRRLTSPLFALSLRWRRLKMGLGEDRSRREVQARLRA